MARRIPTKIGMAKTKGQNIQPYNGILNGARIAAQNNIVPTTYKNECLRNSFAYTRMNWRKENFICFGSLLSMLLNTLIAKPKNQNRSQIYGWASKRFLVPSAHALQLRRILSQVSTFFQSFCLGELRTFHQLRGGAEILRISRTDHLPTATQPPVWAGLKA